MRLLVLLQSCPPPQLLPAFPSFNHRGQQLLPICWVQISISDFFSCLLCLSKVSHPFCECSIASVIVPGLGTSPLAGSYFGPVTGPSFLSYKRLFFQDGASTVWMSAIGVGEDSLIYTAHELNVSLIRNNCSQCTLKNI